jgi:hypothetical protein
MRTPWRTAACWALCVRACVCACVRVGQQPQLLLRAPRRATALGAAARCVVCPDTLQPADALPAPCSCCCCCYRLWLLWSAIAMWCCGDRLSSGLWWHARAGFAGERTQQRGRNNSSAVCDRWLIRIVVLLKWRVMRLHRLSSRSPHHTTPLNTPPPAREIRWSDCCCFATTDPFIHPAL